MTCRSITIHQETGWTNGAVKCLLKSPLGEGQQLIICHVGGDHYPHRWISAPPPTFQLKKISDYHKEMNYNVFENWFFNTLRPNSPLQSTIIMDNALYTI